jgi:hypothetical protein
MAGITTVQDASTVNPSPPRVSNVNDRIPPIRPDKWQEVPPEEVEPEGDPLEELLAEDPNSKIEAEVDMKPHYKTNWVVKALTSKLNEELIDRASTWKKNTRTQQQVRELNPSKYARFVVAYCTVRPNLLDKKIYEKYGFSKGDIKEDQLVEKVIRLPGLIDRLANKILEISGFQEDVVEIAKKS